MNGKLKNTDYDDATKKTGYDLKLHQNWGRSSAVVSPEQWLDFGSTAEFSELHPNQDADKVMDVAKMDKYDGDGRIYAKLVKDGSTGKTPADFRGWVLIKKGNVVKCEIVTKSHHEDPDE